jgi:hypothetical protein
MTVRPIDDGFSISLANRGAAPAVDVAAYAFAAFSEEDDPLGDFVTEWIRPSERVEVLNIGSDPEGIWALRDHLYYAYVPPRQQVVAKCVCPLEPRSVTVLLQTRDVLGRNFARAEWHYRIVGESRYRSAGTEAHSAEEVPRLDLELEPPESVGKVPDATLRSIQALTDAVGDLRMHAFSVAWVEGINADWEDRGEWSDL